MEKTTEISEVKDKLASLCADYEEKAETYAQSEAQTRISLINPFWEALGWNLRDPLQIRVEDPRKGKGLDAKGTKYADYCFYINRREVLVVEAKKPKVDLHNPTAINQLKRYGFNRGIDVGILQDFEEFRPFDTGFAPTELAEANRIKEFDIGYQQYPEYAEKLLNTFGREAVLDGSLEKLVHRDRKKKKVVPIDKIFLEHLKEWRSEIAISIYRNNTELSSHELNESVGRLLNRLLFLRIMEEREIIIEQPLRNIWHDIYESQKAGERGEHYTGLCTLFRRMNKLYNGDLFKEDVVDEILVPNSPLYTALKDLYDKSLPYDYSIMPIEMLGTVYERFLGEVIVVDEKKQAQVEQKPEVRKAGGVYYTPKYIVDYIVEQTVGKLIKGKTPDEIRTIRILDPACGSGSFLIGAFERLTDYYLNWYRKHPRKNIQHAYQDTETGQWKLAFHVKKQILFNNIFGVDIDERAVEGTKFSLYLKLMENENFATIQGRELLPGLADNIKCGNSLIGTDILDMDILPPVGTKERTDELERIRPFDWETEFPRVFVNKPSDAFGATSLAKGGKPTVVSLNNESKPSDSDNVGATSLDKGGKSSVVSLNKGDVERSETEGSSAPTTPSPTPTSSEHPLPRGEGQLPSPSGRRTEDEGFISGGFDAVIGNPPWIRVDNLDVVLRNYLKSAYSSPKGKYDVYYVFIEKGLKLIKSMGLFGQILPNKYCTADSGYNLRKLLFKERRPINILSVSRLKVFEGAANYPVIMWLDQVSSKSIMLSSVIDKKELKDILQFERLNKKTVELLPESIIPINSKERYIILTTNLLTKGIPLGNLAKISEGVRIPQEFEKEKGDEHIVKQYQFSRYSTIVTGSFILKSDRIKVLSASSFRYINSQREKILISEDALKIEATYDNSKSIPQGGVYFVVPDNEKCPQLQYLIGILNSNLMTFVYKTLFSGMHMGGGYLRFRTGFLKHLPIIASESVDIENLVIQMLALHKQLHKEKSKSRKKIIQDDIDHLDKKIDALVYELYGLTEEEIRVVEGG